MSCRRSGGPGCSHFAPAVRDGVLATDAVPGPDLGPLFVNSTGRSGAALIGMKVVRPGMTEFICGHCQQPFLRYASDIAAADRAAIRKGKEPPKQRFCSRTCANLANPRAGRHTGYRDPRIEATEVPTRLGIAWAAGIFEGEGNVSDRVLARPQSGCP